MKAFFPSDDSELKTDIRAETSYADNSDELPDTQLDSLVRRAKTRVYNRFDRDDWYTDEHLNQILFAYACMITKSSIENFVINRYRMGSEEVYTRNSTEENSQQLQQWAQDIREAMDAGNLTDNKPRIRGTGSYIGESSVQSANRHTRYE